MRIPIALACVIAAGCERDARESPDEPPPVPLNIRYAAVAEAASNGANNNYFSIVEDDALFVLAETLTASGDDPGDPAKQAADRMTVALHACNSVLVLPPLVCAVKQTETELADRKLGTVALAAATVRDADVLVVVHGDVDVVRVRSGSGETIERAGRDQVRMRGRANDTIALVNHDLYALLGVSGIARAFTRPTINSDDLERDAKSLTEEAKHAPVHGPLTLVVMQLVHKPG